MKSQLHWDFAHLYSNKLFIKYDLLLFILGCIGLFINLGEVIGPSLAIPFFIMGSFYVIYRTEKALIKKFNS
ncbi:SdpI family protein [Bizionia gelidisalsuginis]|uniref:SdpI family protein n=1 Tax=Bizionia gelidisalsuginis TaxID=291188 RepID=A0ABY3MAW5_9FLAO|nr:SdpI family protein [Bizionia gelidisalsuginis]TYC12896.1 SdpI family protein [Bizionia gelidisalsuginis]